jgi:hypothetical protein
VLSAEAPEQPGKSRLEVLAERLVQEVERGERDALELFKFLEGPSPPPREVLAEREECPRPRILLTGIDQRGRPKSARAGSAKQG